MFLRKNASRIRLREAQQARRNRLEITKGLSLGHVSRRDLFKWGLFTTTGALAWKHGLNPFVQSAFGSHNTSFPHSPLFGVQKFTQPLPRLAVQQPVPLVENTFGHAEWPAHLDERPAKRLSYHTDFTNDPYDPEFINPISGRGPIEGRPPGEVFAHQRWDEFFPKVGYIMSWGQAAPGTRFHPGFPDQLPNSVWTWGTGRFVNGTLPPALIKGRYGEPITFRAYNNTPVDREDHGLFGRNETQLHFHNAHNGAESDGAANVHHFPGTFYDYRWSTTLARHDMINTDASEPRASGPDGNGGLIQVRGDFRELQGTMWAHDHRFFFTAENAYKGNVMMINYYSGPDRGNEELVDGVNLRLPSGALLDSGNTDFDVNLIISDAAFTDDSFQDEGPGQLFYDVFAIDGFLGDVPLVNMAYAPFMEVLPRKYRFRILNASQSRWYQFTLVNEQGNKVPFQFIANDGNLVVNPISLVDVPVQGNAERYDIVVDFSNFPVGAKIKLVNRLEMRSDGAGPEGSVSLSQALADNNDDPVIGPILEFRVVSSVESVDVPGVIHHATDPDPSQVPNELTKQIPVIEPVRTRVLEFVTTRSDTSRDKDGECTPDCPEHFDNFPWAISVNGEDAQTMNANRISLLVADAGDVEHWTIVNGGRRWDHPIHLHFEEGVTLERNGETPPPYENLVRKDVWRLGTNRPRTVKFQVRFGEFGGAYVNHCHNTVHEDFAMILRLQLLTGVAGSPQAAVTPTPNPTPDGVFYTEPEILPEADPDFLDGGGSRSS
jgi:FtsP/CotA-like multicopper oxidase with cupredoxin domain